MLQAKKSPPLLKSGDFQSIECLVVMRNVTTSTDLPKGHRALIVELRKSGLVVQVPKNSCSEGHCLLLRVFTEEEYLRVKNSPRSVQDKAQRISLTAKVKETVLIEADRMLVTLELQQFVEKEWVKFTDSFKQIQKNVSQLVKRIKQ